jgi:tetratricopeptide (TPR) repeat protein
MTPRRSWPLVFCAVAVLMAALSAAPQPEDAPPPVLALREWIEAVMRHVPGAGDRWADAIARLRYADRLRLNDAMTPFLREARQSKRGQPMTPRNEIGAAAARAAREIGQRPGWPAFLKKASVLHADAAILLFRVGGITDATRPPTPPVRFSSNTGRLPVAPPPPLLTNSTWISSQDGQVLGQWQADWNWPFGRSLVDLVRDLSSSPEDADAAAFAGDWYHATSAFMLGNRLYAEATGHLERAVTILPGDARLLFDRACYAELRGLPMQQILREETRPGQRVDLPDRKTTNADAARWLRAALDIDPDFAEARVRLGRLLGVDGQHEAALAEISRALETKPPEIVTYYAHLFAGRSAQALGRIADARRHYAAASEGFIQAQSALLAQSQAALLAGDMPAALEFVRPLEGQTEVADTDPWWKYHLGAGREITPLFAALWARIQPN